MKFIHLADLHLGKRVNDFSMIDEQKNILSQIVEITRSQKPDAVFIAGDVYDKLIPPAEAVALFDGFLSELADLSVQTFVISGNHDSPERIAFGSSLMDKSGVHMSPVYDGRLTKHTLKDEYGEVDIYMLPFIRPANVRRFFEEKEIASYTDAVNAAVDAMDIDFDGKRNILISHQFVTGGATCDSEVFSVGGTDNVDKSAYDGFDYVALGHLHGAQNIGDERIRYSGTPLKYSFSEARHKKSVSIVTLKNKGELEIEEIPLTPINDLREISGELDELIKTPSQDYLHITLTDEVRIPDIFAKLRVYFPNLMKVDYVSRGGTPELLDIKAYEKRTPEEIAEMFFEQQNGRPMNEQQREITHALIEKIWREQL